MTWFILSLIAILFWSGSDLFSKLGSRPDDKYSHWKMVMAVGVVMGAHAFFLIATGTPFSISDIVTYLPASAMYILSMILGYAGLRYIELSISSPICNSSGAVAALLCFFILKETMSGLQFFAVALVCVGVFALSYIEKKQDDALRRREGDTPDKKHTRSFLAILFPILYCIIDGLGTFADALLLDTVIAEEQANIAYELTFLMMAVFAFVYVVIVGRKAQAGRRPVRDRGPVRLCVRHRRKRHRGRAHDLFLLYHVSGVEPHFPQGKAVEGAVRRYCGGCRGHRDPGHGMTKL